MSGYTKGPWRVVMGEGDDANRVYGIQSADADIVETDSGYYPPELADAYLIAAAPDLYEALLVLFRRACRELADVEDVPEVAQAAEAIAKARGEAQAPRTDGGQA